MSLAQCPSHFKSWDALPLGQRRPCFPPQDSCLLFSYSALVFVVIFLLPLTPLCTICFILLMRTLQNFQGMSQGHTAGTAKLGFEPSPWTQSPQYCLILLMCSCLGCLTELKLWEKASEVVSVFLLGATGPGEHEKTRWRKPSLKSLSEMNPSWGDEHLSHLWVTRACHVTCDLWWLRSHPGLQ